MKKKVVVKMYQKLVKEVEVEVDASLVEGKTNEEIQDLLESGSFINDEDLNNLFDKAELETLDSSSEQEDRYDIYENDTQVYGGHL